MEIADIGLRSTRDLPLNDYEKLSIVLLLSSYARSCGIIMNDLERTLKAGKSPGSFTGFDYSDALKKLVTPDRFPDLYPLIISGVYTTKWRKPILSETTSNSDWSGFWTESNTIFRKNRL
ncbi:hypothetical protein RE628_18865 [Paenibacillus sp. D2_2]|uniref:hypothetical protein n=1 Tax=Paenibacillus sp. D2_2 TaxID=3073092 RepID=UPI0028168EB1|nr:hypothetical protein [Paenibacillus sp. D2_2]WMT39476.1 hypothetical protein RE628_18865 [Paenibacillus sp. D2_2]